MALRWTITQDHLQPGERGAAGRGTEPRYDQVDQVALPVLFRLYDDDDELYFSGRCGPLDGDAEHCFAPLDWAMPRYGCTRMDYQEPGQPWKTL